jgi:hypothetical protein
MMPKDLMPLTRLGVGYLYANVSYGRTSTLHRKLARRRRISYELKTEAIGDKVCSIVCEVQTLEVFTEWQS